MATEKRDEKSDPDEEMPSDGMLSGIIDMLGFDPRELNMLGFDLDDEIASPA